MMISIITLNIIVIVTSIIISIFVIVNVATVTVAN